MRTKIEAEFTIVTPMFIGDADQQAHDVRPPSLKGALRFWWRALNWGRMLAAANGNSDKALIALHDREAKLFGLAAGDKTGGQGVFLLTLKQAVKAEEQGFQNMSGAQLYLLGQGLGSFKGGNHTTRSALTSGTFTTSLLFRPRTTDEDQHSVAEALFAFGLLGGLGSRARHGMGSVSLTGWQGSEFSVPQTAAEYGKAIKSLLAHLPDTLPPFTAFSRQSRIDISAENHDPLELLTKVGWEMQMYRSYGRKGKYDSVHKIGNEKALQIFQDDHDLVLAATLDKKVEQAPRRSIFGLPHNYGFSNEAKAEINYKVRNSKGKIVDARRASPLLLHIHRLPNGKYLAVHTLLPATFLPQNASVTVLAIIQTMDGGKKKKRRLEPQRVLFTPDWQVLHTFLNRFKTKETLHG